MKLWPHRKRWSSLRVITRGLFFLFVIASLTHCQKKEAQSSLEIVLPEGDQIKYSTQGFSRYSSKDFQIFLREVIDNKTLQTKAEITPSQTELEKQKPQYEYLVPRGSSINGFLTVQVVINKYSSFPLTAFVFSKDEVIEPSVESTLLYTLISKYPDKDIRSYSKAELKTLLEFIKKFSKARMELFGVKPSTPPKALFNFLRNGLSIDLDFLNLIKSIGVTFKFDAEGNVTEKPYPFGTPNNSPILDDSRSTPTGKLSAYESIRVDIRSEAIDGDDDMLFIYWKYQDEIVLKDDTLWQKIFDFESSNDVDRKNDPPFYKLQSFISDGGRELVSEWQITVADNNRPPELVYDCPTTIREGETFECVFKGVDPDKDLLRFTGLSLDYYNARPTLSEVPWPGPTGFIQEMKFYWKPRNKNFSASKATTLMSLVADDGKAGKAMAALTLNMIDSNTAPYPYVDSNNLVMRQVDDGEGPPRTLQQFGTLIVDPITKRSGTAATAKRFYFELLLIDEDNQRLEEIADFDDVPQPLSGASEFVPETVEPFKPLDANSIVNVFLPDGAPTPTEFDFQHNQLNPSAVVDALSNNPSFQMTLVRNVNMTQRTTFPKGTLFNFNNSPDIDEYSYQLTADVMIPNGDAGSKHQLKVERVLSPPPVLRRYKNVPALNPDDTLEYTTVTVNGQPKVAKRFIYSWLPLYRNPTVTANFAPKDDHGGKGASFRFTKTAEKLAQLPSCAGGTLITFPTSQTAPSLPKAFTCQDLDAPTGGMDYLEMTVTPATTGAPNTNLYRLLPFIRTNVASSTFNAAFFKSNVVTGPNNFLYFAGVPLSGGTGLVKHHWALASGYVLISRPSCSLGTGASTLAAMPTITIPAGTLIRTVYNGADAPNYRPRVTFAVNQATQLGPLECAVLAPLRPHIASRNMAANALSIIQVPVGEANLVDIAVTHPAYNGSATTDAFSINHSITATFKRTADSLTNTIIKAGTAIRSDEAAGAESFVYVVPNPVVLPAGPTGTSVAVRVVRDYLPGSGTTIPKPMTFYGATAGSNLSSAIPADSVTWGGAPINGVLLSQPYPIMPHLYYNLETYYGTTTLSGSLRYLDGKIALANEINSFFVFGLTAGSDSAEATAFKADLEVANLKIRHAAFSDPRYGLVEIYRTQDGPELTIPKDLVMTTTDRRLYRTLKAETLGASNSTFVLVERFFESNFSPTNPATTPLSFTWSDIDYAVANPYFYASPVQSLLNVFVQDAGLPPYEFRIEMGDNNNGAPNGPMVPLDPKDRYYLSTKESATGIFFPTGPKPADLSSMQLCRRPYDMDASCAPCTTADDLTLSNDETRYCYLRFKPTSDDVAKTINARIQLAQKGPVNPGNTVAKTQSFKVVEYNNPPKFANASYVPLPSSCQDGFAENKTYLFDTTVAPATTKAVPPATFDTTCNLPLHTEGTMTTSALFAIDTDKEANNNLIKDFYLSDWVYDLKTKTTIRRPTSMALTGRNSNVLPAPSPSGKKATVSLVWNPNDADSKALSTEEGFIIGVRALDSALSPVSPTAGIAYYKIKLNNTNSAPAIGPITLPNNTKPSSFQIFTNTYFYAYFDVYDNDYFPMTSPAFTTDLSMCRRTDGSLVKHPEFDSGTLGDPKVCHFTGPDWETPFWSVSYEGNKTITQCRNGNGTLNQDLIVPRITRIEGPVVETANKRIRYRFAIEWCPQDAYIGKYNVNLNSTDNGDMARSGTSSASMASASLMSLNVVSNVYFLAPRYSAPGVTVSPRQTAAFAPPKHFIFPMYARNPLGNPLEYSLLPTTTATGIKIDAAKGILSWDSLSPTMPNLATLTTDDPTLIPKVAVQVKDKVTNKIDQVTFALKVQDPNVPPYEQPPEIKILTPANDNMIYLNEKQTQYFTAEAYDANSSGPNQDALWAVWYLDDVIVHEEELFVEDGYNYPLSRYGWRPTDTDGSTVGRSNGTPLSPGEHSLRVAVTDGNEWSQSEWRVRVRNSYIVPDLFLSIQDERKLAEPASNRSNVNTFNWFSELPFASIVTGNTRPTEYLIFSGNFKRNGATRNYLWRVDINDGNITKIPSNTATNGWNYYEYLNLAESGIVQRLAARFDASSAYNPIIYGVTRASKYGAYSGNTVAFQMKGNMAILPTNLSGATYTCPSNCDALMYQAPSHGTRTVSGQTTSIGTYYGKIMTVSIPSMNRNFYVDENSKNLFWDDLTAANKKLIFAATGSTVLNGIAVNRNTRRLFLSSSDGTTAGDIVQIYDIGPALDFPPTDARSKPVLLLSRNITHPTNAGQLTLPSEIAIASKVGRTDQVFIFLRGSGGVLVITDPTDRAIETTDFQFKGMNTIAASQLDVPSSGLKMGYDPVSDNIIGISRGGRQIFTVNPDNLTISVSAHVGSYTTTFTSATDVRMDSLLIMPLTGSIYFVDRKNSMIFQGR